MNECTSLIKCRLCGDTCAATGGTTERGGKDSGLCGGQSTGLALPGPQCPVPWGMPDLPLPRDHKRRSRGQCPAKRWAARPEPVQVGVSDGTSQGRLQGASDQARPLKEVLDPPTPVQRAW